MKAFSEYQHRQHGETCLWADLCPGAEAGGVGDPHHAPHVGGGEPALLVVVGAGQLPPVLLQQTRHTSIVM